LGFLVNLRHCSECSVSDSLIVESIPTVSWGLTQVRGSPSTDPLR
jgi:hypothetical protein